MKNRHLLHHSSLLASPLCIVCLLLLSLAALVNNLGRLSALLFSFFFIFFLSRLMASLAARKVSARLKLNGKSFFAGSPVHLKLEVSNEKFFPLPWMNLNMALPHFVKTKKKEDGKLKDDSSLVLGSLPSYGKKSFSIDLEAEARGVFSTADWTVSTGDSLGLSQSAISLMNKGEIVIYPKIIRVNTSIFLRDLVDSQEIARGKIRDNTLIKSTRDYLPSDSVKNINWRLLARGLPLSVNVFDDIRPESIHLIFDGESFSGPLKRKAQMEEAISIIASLLLSLKKENLNCYLTLPRGRDNKELCIAPVDGIYNALYSLALYNPLADKLTSEGTEVVKQKSSFPLSLMKDSMSRVSHFYYFAYDAAELDEDIAGMIPSSQLTVISYVDSGNASHSVLNMGRLKA